MKITHKRIYLALILFASVLWQPGHHLIMSEGMTMNFGVHTLVTIVPFLSFFLVFGKASWSK